MTERDLQQLLARWQKRMGLDRWELALDLARPSRECGADYSWASMYRSNCYERGTIYLHPDWPKWSAAEAESHVVHELVHVWLCDFEEIYKLIDEQVPLGVDRAIKSVFEFRVEQAVDLIARRLIAISNEAG